MPSGSVRGRIWGVFDTKLKNASLLSDFVPSETVMEYLPAGAVCFGLEEFPRENSPAFHTNDPVFGMLVAMTGAGEGAIIPPNPGAAHGVRTQIASAVR